MSDLSSADDEAAPSDDLSPRALAPVRRRRWLPLSLALLAAVAIAALLFNALGNASLFFKNVDEAVRDRSELEAKRFRVQGTVVEGSITAVEVEGKSATRFAIVYGGVRADVIYIGAPRELFKADVPVVLEGRWRPTQVPGGTVPCGANDGWYFDSNDMIVKHDNSYEAADKQGRLDQAKTGGAASTECPTPAGKA